MADNRSTEEKLAEPKDWRGTPIEIGSPVIYGAPVGRSIELVEAEVVGFSKTGRVNLKVTRRGFQSGSSYSKKTVHVGQDRLIVINPDGLPPTELPTHGEQVDQSKTRRAEDDRIYATHSGPDWGPVEHKITIHSFAGPRENIRWYNDVIPCEVCGAKNRYMRECPGPVAS